MLDKLDYQKLISLNKVVKNKTASKEQKDEYMRMLYLNGNITKEQYEQYIQGKKTDEVVEAALTIGAILLVTYLLGQLFSK